MGLELVLSCHGNNTKKYLWAVFWLLIQLPENFRISRVIVDPEPQLATTEPMPMKGCNMGVPKQRGAIQLCLHCLLGGKMASNWVLTLKYWTGDSLVNEPVGVIFLKETGKFVQTLQPLAAPAIPCESLPAAIPELRVC